MRRTTFLVLLTACILFAPTTSRAGAVSGDFQPSSEPLTLHVAWLDGRSLAEASTTGAVLLDRFPDAVIVADEASSLALRQAGFRVEGPFAVPAGITVTLVRERGAAQAAPFDAQEFEHAGAQLLWSGGRNAIALSDGPLPETAHAKAHAHKVLADTPLRMAPTEEPAAVTDFFPVIQTMVDQVSGTRFIDWIRDMANGRATTVGGAPVTFTTRASHTQLCDKAEQWAYERLVELGYTDVQYDPYTFGTTSARNVVATLPGTETPDQVIVLGAHLDSTSPVSSTLAPGANDNASGVAGLLEIARILRGYSFEKTIRFIAFTGEEQGLYGSQHYASAAAARGDIIDAAVIFDMIGWHNLQNKIDIEGETPYLPIMNVMKDACTEYTTLATNMVIGSWGSDHVPFQNAGYSSFLAIENEYPDYPCYHQTCDSVAWNQPVFGAEVMKAGIATVAHLAGARPLHIAHTPLPSTENTTTPYEVVADISKLSPLVPDSLLLHWSRGGPWTSTQMTATATPNRWHAYIPAQPNGTVSYWLSARDSAGLSAVHPLSAPASVNQFIIASRETLFAEGFETGASGWTHGGVKDDWQVGAPSGLYEDPASAYAGSNIAGTDVTGVGGVAARYDTYCDTWFESPAVDCSDWAGVRLSFARKLAIERSVGNTRDWAQVQINGTPVWESSSSVDTKDPAWTLQNLDISAAADGRSSVKIKWTLHSNGSFQYGGWNLDEIRITGISTTAVATDVATPAPRPALVLAPSIPNPVASTTLLRFELARAGRTELAVFDVGGRHVRTLVDGELGPGLHKAVWDARDSEGRLQGSGIYFYRLTSAGKTVTQRLTLLR